jgi:hypothetical protein
VFIPCRIHAPQGASRHVNQSSPLGLTARNRLRSPISADSSHFPIFVRDALAKGEGRHLPQASQARPADNRMARRRYPCSHRTPGVLTGGESETFSAADQEAALLQRPRSCEGDWRYARDRPPLAQGRARGRGGYLPSHFQGCRCNRLPEAPAGEAKATHRARPHILFSVQRAEKAGFRGSRILARWTRSWASHRPLSRLCDDHEQAYLVSQTALRGRRSEDRNAVRRIAPKPDA